LIIHEALVLVILSAYAPKTLNRTEAKSQVKCCDALESIIHEALEGTEEYALATLEGIEEYVPKTLEGIKEYALLLVLFSLFFCFFLGCFFRYFFQQSSSL